MESSPNTLRQRRATFNVKELTDDTETQLQTHTTTPDEEGKEYTKGEKIADDHTNQAESTLSSAPPPSSPATTAPPIIHASTSPAPVIPSPRRRDAESAPDFVLVGFFFILLAGALLTYLMSDRFIDASRMTGRGRKMQDTEFKLVVSLEAVYQGTTVQSEYPGGRQIVCPHCSGSGGEGPDGVTTCTACGGTGRQIHKRQVAPNFWQTFSSTCNQCGGKGVHIARTCRHCGGHGLVKDDRPLSINIPPGLPEGYVLRLPGQGDQPHAREKYVDNGDVFVTILTKPNRFERRGQDLWLKQELSLRQALLGFEIDITLLDGSTIRVAHSSVTQPGTVEKLEGRGLPAFDPAAARIANDRPSPGLIGWMSTHVSRPISRAIESFMGSKRNDVIPPGNLFIEYNVRWPNSPTFTAAAKSELKQLLG